MTLGIIGGVSSIAGIYFVKKASWSSYSTSTSSGYSTQDGSGITGMALLVVGIPLTITGAVLTLTGNKKKIQYQNKLDKLSIGVTSNIQMTGFNVTYSF